jgi:hypothetical protein
MNLIPTRFFLWLFRPLEPEARVFDVLLWWEKRRVAYNLLVFVWGVAGLLIFFLSIPGDLHVEWMWIDLVIALLQSVFSINFCYTLGWIVAMPGAWLAPESKPWLSPLLMKWGLALTALVIAAPPMLLIVLLAVDLFI